MYAVAGWMAGGISGVWLGGLLFRLGAPSGRRWGSAVLFGGSRGGSFSGLLRSVLWRH